ncbi:SDR family oxidoreductase [Dehalobacter sp. DCM]|uniref:SDR family NAD(P)-dependent oxidoreductase n=1 Tax=Dehalobacter sp. DCM TaxID=2907827 RepID=UPI003081E185|nr:SDR family oxidoreductase [Dehalobacter sp. DCM]
MANRLTNKVALITGATSGIGKATAEIFAAEGAKVIFVGRRTELGQAVEDGIRAKGGEATFIQCDVTVQHDLENVINRTIEKYGQIDILFNNAGAGYLGHTHEMDIVDFDALFNLNIRSYFTMTKLVLPYMMKQRNGSIINCGSVGGIVGMPNNSAYSSSKGAVSLLTKSLAVEYAAYNIRVNALCPGMTTSDLVPAGGDVEKLFAPTVPLGRPAKPEEMAYAAVFFGSDECTYCTGALLVVDGGVTSA